MTIFGIVNLTRDSFLASSRHLDPDGAIDTARRMIEGGADAVDLGAAASNPNAEEVPPTEEIRRLTPVMTALVEAGIPFSVDTCQPETQVAALDAGASWINDILGFEDPAVWPLIAAKGAGAIVMHSVHRSSRARIADDDPTIDEIAAFLRERAGNLVQAGVDPTKILVDPGMGFFLSSRPEPSLNALARVAELREKTGFEVLISVSRKSFVRNLVGRSAEQSGVATLAAELFAIDRGATAIRTHDPGALADALTVREALARYSSGSPR